MSVAEPRVHRIDVGDLHGDAPVRRAEFYKIGLTDCYGRPIYVQRW